MLPFVMLYLGRTAATQRQRKTTENDGGGHAGRWERLPGIVSHKLSLIPAMSASRTAMMETWVLVGFGTEPS